MNRIEVSVITKDKKILITTFTDPMMGLSYQMEPIFRKLETHFNGYIQFKYVMSGLVRDVYDFVDPNDLIIGKEFALKNYLVKLAKIYESEETITGMPMNMSDLQLFSTSHTSSIPLNLAYKAAQLTDNNKADLFLYNLRYATIVDCKPTTKFEEIISIAKKTGIDLNKFSKHYEDGSAQLALDKDYNLTSSLAIYRLPAYLIKYGDKSILINYMMSYIDFLNVIEKLTQGELRPKQPEPSLDNISSLINTHPLISPIEIKEAFNLRDIEDVKTLIKPLLDSKEIAIKNVHHGWFIQKL